MAGNDWWQAPKDAKNSRSAKAPNFDFPRSSGSHPAASKGIPATGAPPASGRGIPSLCEPPSRQASRASRQGSAPNVEPRQDVAGASTKPVRILRRPKQADTAASSSENHQGSAIPLFRGDVQVRGSPASDASPQGRPVNRKARRAHMQWQSPSSAAQEDALVMSSSAPPSFIGHGRQGGPVPSPIGGGLGSHPLLGAPSPLPGLNSAGSATVSKKTRFPVYASHEELGQGLKKGHFFKGAIRVNAHDRSQAYVTLPGLPSDLMIRGSVAQNRAVEGDIVALEVLSLSSWFISSALVKTSNDGASALHPSASTPAALGDGALELPDEGSPEALPATAAGGCSAVALEAPVEAQQAKGMSVPDEPASGATPAASCRGEAGSGESGSAGRVRQRKGTRKERVPISTHAELVEATRAQLEASFGGGSKPPWADAETPEQALQIISALLLERPELRATAKVVGILEPSRRRGAVVGVLKEEPGGGALLLNPCDPRLPRCLVRSSELPNDLKSTLKAEAKNLVSSERTLVSGMIESWDCSAAFPLAQIRSSLGQAGYLATESKAMMHMEAVTDEPFSDAVMACLPVTPWSISDEEIARRRDLRSTRICSIDPLTARDLDDALSVEPLPGGRGWRVGVHIADVAHFVAAGSALDAEAAMRGTSVYMVDRVIPMLPRLLCEELCSLNPGVDRLTFSVIWEMTEEGKVLSQWAGRTVIRSCTKLAYEHAQAMIEGTFDAANHPAALSSPHTWLQVVEDVLTLHKIAAARRKARFENGALRLDNVKLNFELDAEGNPCNAHPHVQREANQLVEEFMLLANMAVAGVIAKAFPDRALLRRHPPPHQRKMEELAVTAAGLDVSLDVSSAAALQASLAALRDHPDPRMLDIVQLLATKPMQLARYFCTGEIEDPSAWGHYALAVPEYTHFTSPIRRYPDIVVHRLLAAALALDGEEAAVEVGEEWCAQQGLMTTQQCADVAKHCNDRKQAAKLVQEASARLYLAVLLRRRPLLTEGIVMGLNGARFLDVYIPDLGTELRIQVEDIAPAPVYGDWDAKAKTLEISRPRNAPADGDAERPHPAVLADIDNFAAARGNARPAALPLQLSMFSRVPVLVSARQHGASGRPAEPFARLFLSG
ncbi:DIS3-like exonuclease 2 [Coccomyxa sp. Obi]|nr:DIS3-like exonuclease 2 [Coccomyxa sp. Obi]